MENTLFDLFEGELTPKRGTKIPVGIHTACKITGIDVAENHVDINFENSEGLSHNKRLWKPKGNYPNKIKDAEGVERMETPAEAVARETRTNFAHLAAVSKILLSEDELTALKAAIAKKTEYQDVVAEIAKKINPTVSRKLVNLKLLPDAEGKYSEFSNGRFPDYIEEYVEGAEPKLKYTDWELENRFKNKAKPAIDSVVDKLLS